jgi:hypothetical protein
MFNSRQVLAIENHLEHRYFLCGCYFPLQQQFLHRLISEERQVTIGIKHRMARRDADLQNNRERHTFIANTEHDG